MAAAVAEGEGVFTNDRMGCCFHEDEKTTVKGSPKTRNIIMPMGKATEKNWMARSRLVSCSSLLSSCSKMAKLIRKRVHTGVVKETIMEPHCEAENSSILLHAVFVTDW